jgi:FolB domain-containing protein
MKHSCSDWIHLTEASFPCIVGLLDWERSTPQPLAVEISLNVDLDGAADGDLSRSVNYATTLLQVEFIAREGQWELLESLGAALARLLLAPPASGEGRTEVSQVMVRLRKPAVLSGRAIPCIELRRPSSWLTLSKLVNGAPGVALEVLQEACGTGAYRIHVDRDSEWTIPDNMACMLIAGAGVAKSMAPTIGDVLRSDAGTFRASAPVCFIGVSRETRPNSTTEGEGEARDLSKELPN